MSIKNNNDYNLSLFDTDEVQEYFDSSNRLDVVKMEYIGAESVEWKELFNGFDKLNALGFVCTAVRIVFFSQSRVFPNIAVINNVHCAKFFILEYV